MSVWVWPVVYAASLGVLAKDMLTLTFKGEQQNAFGPRNNELAV